MTRLKVPRLQDFKISRAAASDVMRSGFISAQTFHNVLLEDHGGVRACGRGQGFAVALDLRGVPLAVSCFRAS